jgi:hypothetical protein
MSYDDGKVQDVRLIEIFNRYGIKGTFNLNGNRLFKEDHLKTDGEFDPEKFRAIYAGHEVATHTFSHTFLTCYPLSHVAQEIIEDRIALENVVGAPVRGHAYPYGRHSEDARRVMQEMGIVYGRTTKPNDDFGLPEDWMQWKPNTHHRNPELMAIARQFVEMNAGIDPRLLYVWGHSYEFDSMNNWEVIEEFCEFMGGRENIWYATNIEIYDYMEAVKRLCFSADLSKVYNPSAISVWVFTDKNGTQSVEIKPGCVVELTE